MFVDKATIRVKAGAGGNGAVSFHREKYVPAGGPDGGDGGRGGDVVLKTDPNMSTLMDFRYKRKYAASNGVDGGGKVCTGKDGESLVIKVPNGTLVRDKETGAIIKDMTGVESFVVARGGLGGWGNRHFATPTRQAPRFAKSGLPGEDREVTLELKLLADVGLVGYPNVGKSTLLSVVSKAHPKIADYHFTTLFPNLGVVYIDEGVSFVMADIPGIIEGASEGAGLGHDFLRHIDRCRLLIHVVDASGSEGRDPIEDFKTINSELQQYSPELAARPQLVAANKTDIAGDSPQLDEFRKFIRQQGLELFEISAATNSGVRELVNAAAAKLNHLPPVVVYEPEFVEKQEPVSVDDLKIEVVDDIWVIEGKWMERLVRNINFSDNESMSFFDRSLRNAGVYDRLETMGIKEGDTVSIYNLEFDYTK
ncbi:GTP-binding protein [Sporobacter termitidis DSM 10068]|uniref:GTPase Obg n=1 Tax=Sporobacter termitidis DSM 10068 TaxID=1123282 RepID=A0A1M5WXX2_9FIRM|nr:GTPase ObgE [Sporobacter termitidis]SHH92212.1 GTP-binding protein [Sporobacter termitidis DSM 10068]